MPKTRKVALEIIKRFADAGVELSIDSRGSVSCERGKVADLFGYSDKDKKKLKPILQLLTRQNRRFYKQFILDYSELKALFTRENPQYWEQVEHYLMSR
jgi:organic radical activating enzyme